MCREASVSFGLAAVVAAIVLTGCGYRAGALVAGDIATVHVAMFENSTFYRGVEVQLTDAVRMEIARRTRLRLAEPDRADSVLTGRVVGVSEKVLTHDPAGNVFTREVTVYADFEWRDRRTGRVLAHGARLAAPARLLPGVGADTSGARMESAVDLARTIVNRMEGEW